MTHDKLLKKYADSVCDFLENLSEETLKKLNQKVLQSADTEHKKFLKALREQKCYICDLKLNTFILEKPCLHWLLRPMGFKKKDFPLIFRKFNYLRIDSYLRWIANTEIPAANINDLEDDENLYKIIEYTIKYQALEWSFSCSKGDLAGHTSRSNRDGRSPHYHFQMRIDNRPFIDYGDFHIPFTDEDLWHLPIILGQVKEADYLYDYGMGMQDMMTKIQPEELLNSMQRANDESESTYHLSTIIHAEVGKTLSGSELADMFKKNKQTGIPIAKLAREMKNLGNIETIITPGPRVPDQAGRKIGRKKK